MLNDQNRYYEDQAQEGQEMQGRGQESYQEEARQNSFCFPERSHYFSSQLEDPLPAMPQLRRSDCPRCDYGCQDQEAICTCPIEDQVHRLRQKVEQIEESLQSFWKKQESDDGPCYISINGLKLPVNTKKRKGQNDGGPIERALRICHELYDKVNVRPTYRILRKFRFGSTTTHRALQRWHDDRIAMQEGQLASSQGMPDVIRS
jgi:hypothetical protein